MAAALLALMGGIGAATFVAMRDDPAAPATTTSSTVTSSSPAEVARAIAASLEHELEVPLSPEQARCVTDVLLALVHVEELQRLAGAADPLASVGDATRERLVRGLVGCVPPETAAALLGASTTTTPAPVQLPDEGG